MSRSIRIAGVSSLMVAAVVGGVILVQGCASGGGGRQPGPAAAIAGSTSCDNLVKVGTEMQRSLIMAYAANGSAGICNSTSDATAVAQVAGARAQCVLDEESEGWTIVWGPVVQLEQNTPSPGCPMPIPAAADNQWLPANTMFVARKQGAAEYLVAIAGTDPESLYDWCDEDFTVSEHATWTYGSAPSDAWITKGTSDGLQALTAMSDPTNGSLVDFLASEVRSGGPIQLTVTGHSLGGALAPVAALWLKDEQASWDPAKQSTIDVYAFAGATPGNASFADYLNAQFPGDSLTVVDNPSDLVPRAWNSTRMDEVDAGFYDRFPAYIKATKDSKIYNLFEALEVQATTDFTRLGDTTQQQCIAGNLATKGALDWLVPLPSDHDAFDREALFQHIGAYPVALQLSDLVEKGHTCNCANPPPGGWSQSGGCMPKPQYCS